MGASCRQTLTTTMKNKPSQTPFWTVGNNYFIRTVTFHYTGNLVGIEPNELVFKDVAWIADSGRFQQALETCLFSEVEMYPVSSLVMISRGSIVDAVSITTLPTSQK